MTRDRQLLAEACRALLRFAGMDADVHWTAAGPTRRASWLKGYLRRDFKPGSRQPEQELSRQQKVVLLVVFDLWNRSGDVLLRDVLDLPARLLEAISSLIPLVGARGQMTRPESDPLVAWLGRWG
jgi:hypothetical protein